MKTVLFNNKEVPAYAFSMDTFRKDPIRSLILETMTDVNPTTTLQFKYNSKIVDKNVLIAVFAEDKLNILQKAVLALVRMVL